MPIHMAEARRRELAETPGLTLDGRPARSAGAFRS